MHPNNHAFAPYLLGLSPDGLNLTLTVSTGGWERLARINWHTLTVMNDLARRHELPAFLEPRRRITPSDVCHWGFGGHVRTTRPRRGRLTLSFGLPRQTWKEPQRKIATANLVTLNGTLFVLNSPGNRERLYGVPRFLTLFNHFASGENAAAITAEVYQPAASWLQRLGEGGRILAKAAILDSMRDGFKNGWPEQRKPVPKVTWKLAGDDGFELGVRDATSQACLLKSTDRIFQDAAFGLVSKGVESHFTHQVPLLAGLARLSALATAQYA